MKQRLLTLDFETLPIRSRPHYPPEPVGFSLRIPEWKAPRYFAWGHKTGGNNCNRADAARVLKLVYQRVSREEPLLCFNNKFDMDVAWAHFGLQVPPWDHFHDAMFLVFLDDPHQRELGLKPSATRILGMDREEQDTVKEWVLEHKKQLEQDFPEIVSEHEGIKPSTAGAFIAYVPGEIVAPYANGDVSRAEGVFHAKYHEVCIERGMKEAYDRERRLLPILLRNEREGVRVDEAALARDQPIYEAAQAKADAWLRKALKAPSLDLDKDAEVAKALDASGQVTEWTLTKTGRKSTSKKNMKLSHFKDPKVASTYSYRQKCATTLETFIRPWLKFSSNGRMHTTWNQVRQAKKQGDPGGTRTGRPSSDNPNFLNMPKSVKDDEVKGFRMPTHIELPSIPRVRGYILSDEKDHWIGRRDYNQQELRVLAHFEDGALLAAYLQNPRLDVHEFLRLQILEQLGLELERDITKTLNFGYIYGQGLGSLAEKLSRTVEEVKKFRNAQMQALPGLKKLSDGLKARSKQGLPIMTWGGRQYYVEPPKWNEKEERWMEFGYKLLNYLVQGSSADVTKESIIRYDSVRKNGRFMLSVYDENDISAPKKALKEEMLLLRTCMMSIELDVPLISDGEWGENLGSLSKLEEPPPDLSKWGLTYA
jgi:DNA polymerase I-like protein with 3'-5' exonuclease and polymerase domains